MRLLSVVLCFALLPLIVGATDGGQVEAAFPAVCPALTDSAIIPGLATGQAVSSGGSVTLSFSSNVFTCGDFRTDVSTADCRDSWSFHLTVPAEALSVGVHNLSAVGAEFGDMVNRLHLEHRDGCQADQCQGSTEGIGSVSLLDQAATLEITAASDTCITGRLTGLRDPLFKNAPSFNGEFFALRCP